MKRIDLSNIRLILIVLILFGVSYLIASIYFIAINSNVNEYIPYGQSQINFENDELDQLNFEFTGNSNWISDCNESYTGMCSIRSDTINHDENNTITITLNVINPSYIDFYYKVDSEYSTSGNEFYDGLKFYINGELVEQFQPNNHGESSWSYYYTSIEIGVQTITWAYVKDGGDGATSSEIDCAWLDDISFPLSEPLYYILFLFFPLFLI